MLISTEYFVFLWLLPVTLFIIMPLAVGLVWLTASLVRQLTSNRVPHVTAHAKSLSFGSAGRSQRRGEDRQVPGKEIMVHVSDGANSSRGQIANVSQHGICVQGVSSLLSFTCAEVTVVLSEAAGKLRLQGKTCWTRMSDRGPVTLGMVIVEPSDEWRNFITSAS
jgi:hypothetical protein